MPKNISGAPSPDTSPTNIARVLRQLDAYAMHAPPSNPLLAIHAEGLALADALDARPTPMTWEDRKDIACRTFWSAVENGEPYDLNYAEITVHQADRYVSAAIRKAFPELAPSDD